MIMFLIMRMMTMIMEVVMCDEGGKDAICANNKKKNHIFLCLGGALQEQPHHVDHGDGLQLPGRSRLVSQPGQASLLTFIF